MKKSYQGPSPLANIDQIIAKKEEVKIKILRTKINAIR